MRKKAVSVASRGAKAAVSNRGAKVELHQPRPSGESGLVGGWVVLMELGAEWPGLTEQTADVPRRVIAQIDGETPQQFAARAGDLLDGLFGRGVPLAAAVLACNQRLDSHAEDARRKLAGLALGAMARQKTGKVYLAASDRSSARLRQGLTHLAQGLQDEWRTAGLEASVSFGEARSEAERPASSFSFTARVA